MTFLNWRDGSSEVSAARIDRAVRAFAFLSLLFPHAVGAALIQFDNAPHLMYKQMEGALGNVTLLALPDSRYPASEEIRLFENSSLPGFRKAWAHFPFGPTAYVSEFGDGFSNSFEYWISHRDLESPELSETAENGGQGAFVVGLGEEPDALNSFFATLEFVTLDWRLYSDVISHPTQKASIHPVSAVVRRNSRECTQSLPLKKRKLALRGLCPEGGGMAGSGRNKGTSGDGFAGGGAAGVNSNPNRNSIVDEPNGGGAAGDIFFGVGGGDPSGGIGGEVGGPPGGNTSVGNPGNQDLPGDFTGADPGETRTVSEPGSFALLVLGLASVYMARRFKP